jgi:hypothetical protein
MEMFPVYFKNHTKTLNTFCVQNVEVMVVEAGGTYSYH